MIPNENVFGIQQFKQLRAFAERKKKKDQFDHLIVTGDLNVANETFYLKLKEQFEGLGLRDVVFEVQGKREETFGVLNEVGEPLETLLTRKADLGKMECLDYILTDLEPLNAEVNHFKEPKAHKPWQQVSDHSGIVAELKLWFYIKLLVKNPNK